jgi:hypothetical protein
MPGKEPSVWRKLAWFLSLWVAGVAALAVVAGLIRSAIT